MCKQPPTSQLNFLFWTLAELLRIIGVFRTNFSHLRPVQENKKKVLIFSFFKSSQQQKIWINSFKIK